MAIKIRRTLLTSSWTEEVDALETAVGRFRTDRPLANDCEIVFFEMVGDQRLHVNVTHSHPTRSIRGWAGPGKVLHGYVHNRRFGHARRRRIIRHVREIVLAPKL
jgi:hypothetical protein